MNEFTIKKMAEVQAFTRLAPTITGRAGTAFAKQIPDVHRTLSTIDQDLGRFIGSGDQTTLFAQKQHKTLTKLIRMMELYVGNDWDDPIEVLEWLSFYAGSAAAHCALAASALEALGQKDAHRVFAGLTVTYQDLAAQVISHLSSTGSRLAVANVPS